MDLAAELAESILLAENIGLTLISSFASSSLSIHITGISFLGGKLTWFEVRVPLCEENINLLLIGFLLNINDVEEALLASY